MKLYFYKQKLVWTPVNSEYKFTIIPEIIFLIIPYL